MADSRFASKEVRRGSKLSTSAAVNIEELLDDPLGPSEREKIQRMPTSVLRKDRLLMILLAFMRRPELQAVGGTMRAIEPLCLIVARRRRCRLYLCGGSDGKNPTGSARRLDPSSGTWEELPQLCKGRILAAGASLLGSIYVCGGSDGQEYLASVERFNLDSGCWQQMPPMHHSRSAAAAVAINGLLYIFGGRDANNYLNTLECFDPRLDEWRGLAQMAERRGYAAGIRMAHHLYAFGGFNGKNCLRSVERFDTKANLPEGSWESMPSMPNARSQAAGCNLRGCAWLCGGSDGVNHLSSISRFDPATGHWDTYLPGMLSFRSFASVGIINGQPYVAGGFDGKRFMGSAERLDLDKRRWEALLPMADERAWAATAVLEHHDHASAKSAPRIEYRTLAELEAIAAELT